ncbi:sulfatase-like hydrolase/transferase [bacterium]|nr:sulfatase-like hydrolase/transferase [bacterium]
MPHCLVICSNGLQAAYLGAYGNPWIHTPNIDRLAAEGVVFDWHFPDNLTTLPTRRSWWSGRYTLHDELLGWGPVNSPDEFEALRSLDSAGVRTTLISDCPYVNDPDMGYTAAWSETLLIRGSGYDAWCEPGPGDPPVESEPGLRLPPADDPHHDLWKDRWANLLRNRQKSGRLHDVAKTGAGQVIDTAIDWLEQRDRSTDRKPFLLWLDIFCPHGPWDIPEEFRDYYAAEAADQFVVHETGDLLAPQAEQAKDVAVLVDVPGGWVGDAITDDELVRLRKTYAGAVTLLDNQVGRLLDHLDRTGKREEIVVIFVSDQGEPLGEHDFVRRPIASVHEELAHTPLIVRWPSAAENGQRCAALVQTVDLAPTLCESLGVEPPEDWPGQSLAPLLNDHESPWRDSAVYAMDNETFAIRTRDWLLIEEPKAEDESVADEDDEANGIERSLYVKPEDRWEIHDVSSMHSDVVDELSEKLHGFLENHRIEEKDA